MTKRNFCTLFFITIFHLVTLTTMSLPQPQEQEQPQQSPSLCYDRIPNCSSTADYFPNKFIIKYAKQTLLNLTYHNTFVDLTIRNSAGTTWEYRLVRCGCKSQSSNNRSLIEVPPTSVYVEETTTLSLLAIQIPLLDRVKAVLNKAYNDDVNNRIKHNMTKRIGKEGDPFSADYQKLKDIRPALSLLGASPFKGVDDYEKADTGIPFFTIAESEEVSPLARAEYVKVIGLLFDKVGLAKKVFKRIEEDYVQAKEKAEKIRRVPSVLLNMPFMGLWHQTGGRQYIAQFLRDSNVDYRFMNDGKNQSHAASVKEVVEKFQSAQYWIHAYTVPGNDSITIETFLANQKDLLALHSFASIRCGNLWVNMKRVSEDGHINDFLESAVVRPNLMLQDMIAIFHPSLMENKTLTYSYNLERPKGAVCPYNRLPIRPSSGKVFVDIKIEVKGASRFDVEDSMLASLAKSTSQAAGVEENNQEILFEKRSEKDDAAVVTVRFMVAQSRAGEIQKKASGVSRALQSGIGGNRKPKTTIITTKVIPGQAESMGNIGDDGVSTGIIVGIVLGAVSLAILSSIMAWMVAYKRGRDKGYMELRKME